ncbi:con-10 family general stress protein [Bosea rubneri]|uniref:KGG domain-containing protein n=1 Tax=Bosea rubneri TaxID=3075434 RepID=A0ABU3SFM6_9HYPH|nr:KGG domain-containing protein [Bosea sp. ZW T0_25]MDU0343182.1 KGG domain-containing protein [Bosea sp. ZW T0_25]
MANNDQRGFGSMDSDKQRDIASKGGQSVPDEKRSFSQDRELASEAGRKGGENSTGGQQQAGQQGRSQQGGDGQEGRDSQRGGEGNFANDRERASEAGRKGGQS